MSNTVGTVQSAVSAGSGVLDFSMPSHPKGRTLYTGNFIVANVEGEKMLLTARELQRLLAAGYDVEAFGYPRDTV